MENKIFLCILLGTMILVSSCAVETQKQVPEEQESLNMVECKTDDDCATGGCSGQVCRPKEKVKDLFTTCEWRPEYGCLKMTSCSCIDGKCIWGENQAYLDCIAGLEKEKGCDLNVSQSFGVFEYI